MTPEVRQLLDEIRALITEGRIREIPMFGAVAVMVDDAMAVAVNKDGSLLVRVDPSEDEALLLEADATRAEMGKGREMGPGWLRVDLRGDSSRLEHWVTAALRRRSG
jgi:TfoX/Sxy family transcriptional regulator of competence genes